MDTTDQKLAAPPAPRSEQKRTYRAPQVTELGDVRDLTRGGGGSVFDGPGRPGKA